MQVAPDSTPQVQLLRLMRLAASDVAGRPHAPLPDPQMGSPGPSVQFRNVHGACAPSQLATARVEMARQLLQVSDPPDSTSQPDAAGQDDAIPEIGEPDSDDDNERKWIVRVAVVGGLRVSLHPAVAALLQTLPTSNASISLNCVHRKHDGHSQVAAPLCTVQVPARFSGIQCCHTPHRRLQPTASISQSALSGCSGWLTHPSGS